MKYEGRNNPDVLVRWRTNGAVLGQSRAPGEQDVMKMQHARPLEACGMVEVLGLPERAVPMLTLESEDE